MQYKEILSIKPKHVAVFHNLPNGGAKRYIYDLIDSQKNNYIFDEYTLSCSSSYLDLKPITRNQYYYNYFVGKGLIDFEYRILNILPNIHKQIACDIESRNYDKVIINHDYLTKSPYLLKFLRSKNIYICHEPQREFHEPNRYHSPRIKDKIANIIRYPIKHIDINNARHASVIVANSNYSKRILQKIYRRNDIKVIYPGIDIDRFNIRKTKKENQILSIGSLLPIKGHDLIIASIAKLNSIKPHLVIVGNGRPDDKSKLMQIALKKGVKLSILSNISDKDLIKEYSKSRLVVSAAYKEPFGLSITEAMSMGVPVVVTNDGGSREQVVNGVNGYICDRNPFSLSQAIHLGLSRKFNSHQIRKTAAEKFNRKVASQKILSL